MTSKITIIGAGAIGRSWAIVFARAGYDAILWGRDQSRLDQALATIDDQLDWLTEAGIIEGDPQDIRDGIIATTDLGQALDGAVYVQENLPENLGIKREIFLRLDQATDETVPIGSSTSGIPSSRFTEDLAGRARCLAAHPVNPPHLIPVVELAPAPWTEPEITDRVRTLLKAVGQKPVVLKRETPGFLLNRLQGALANEAFRLVAEGYASPEDVDAAIADGLGLRWSFMGPFETLDLNSLDGLDRFARDFADLFYEIGTLQAEPLKWDDGTINHPVTARRAALALDDIAGRQTWRDQRLAATIVAKRKADREIGT